MASNQIVQAERHAIAHPVPAALPGPHRPPENPLLLIRRYLRGRYIVAALLGIALSIPCAVAGYFAVPPMYESVGSIRVAPTKPKILYQNEENSLMPMFESFVSAQATLLESQRVLSQALEKLTSGSEKERSPGWPTGDEGMEMLARRLEVTYRRGTEVIQVAFKNPRPQVAKKAVDAVLAAYIDVEADVNGRTGLGREKALTDRVNALKIRLDTKRNELESLAQIWGTDDLDQLHSAKMSDVVRLESIVAELDLQLTRTEGTPGPSETPEPVSYRVELIALSARDETLRSMLDQEQKLESQLSSKSRKLSPTHRTVIELKDELEALQQRIRERAEIVAKAPNADQSLAAGASTREQIEKLKISFVAKQNEATDRLKAVSETRMKLRTVKEQMAEIQKDLDEANTRIDQMKVEETTKTSGRVGIFSEGSQPLSPSTDRRLPLAIFGAIAGLCAGIGAVWGYGFLRDGFRYVEELESIGPFTPLLGIIPELSESNSDQDEQAALSVHHLRNTLQLQTDGGPPGRARIYTVTSGAAGDGKTHLALALGLSFAMAGRRTLLIDADLVGRALSSQLGMRGAEGLSEAIEAEALNGEIHAVKANLWLLPAGSRSAFQPEQLSSSHFAQVLDRVRSKFDTVIIDSGPIMGSLEANLAGPLSDRVVLVVSRGQDPKVVKAAVARLRSIGAVCAGIIFNRAMARDFAQSMSVASASRLASRRGTRTGSSGQTSLTRLSQNAPANSPPGRRDT